MRQLLQSVGPWKSRVAASCLDLWAVQGSDLWAVQGPQGWELKADAELSIALTC